MLGAGDSPVTVGKGVLGAGDSRVTVGKGVLGAGDSRGPSVGKGVLGAGDSRITPPVGANVLFVPASTKTDVVAMAARMVIVDVDFIIYYLLN